MSGSRPGHRPAMVDRVITEDGHPPDDSILQTVEETGRLPAVRVASERGLPRHLPHESAQQRSTAPSDRSPFRFVGRPIPATETSITNRTLLHASAQTKELRVPSGDAVGGTARVAPVVGELVTKPRRDARREWIAVDVPQHVQDVPLVAVGDPGSVVAGFPEVAAATEKTVQTHRGVPVEPVHDPRQFIGATRLDQVVDMIAHHRDGVDASPELFGRPSEGVKHEEPSLLALQVEGPVVAPHRDVRTATRTTASRRSRHEKDSTGFERTCDRRSQGLDETPTGSAARTRTRTLLKAGVFDAPSRVRGTRMFASG